MKAHLLRLWEAVRTSFWFVPALMAAGASVLAFVAMHVDRVAEEDRLHEVRWLHPGGADGTREVLAVIAGSMITVAGVAFSVTIVALSLASQQLGPRLLRNFMRDPGNQIVLGTFVATFLYCLLVLRTIYDGDDDGFVPTVAVAVAVALALLSLGVLIYFIHHVSMSIQAPKVVALVGRDLIHAIDGSYPERMGHAPSDERAEGIEGELPPDFDEASREVESKDTGYVQAIDNATLMKLASQGDAVIRIVARPGQFVVQGRPLARMWPADRVDPKAEDRINYAFVVGDHRTPTQDVEFALDQLVEMALRALSPSLNDPFTALSCVDWLGAALSEVARREQPSPFRLDDAGKLRIVTEQASFEGLADAAFHQLRQKSRRDVAVTCRLLETITDIAEVCRGPSERDVLRRHADLIFRGSLDLPEQHDRDDVERRYRQALECLEKPGEGTA